MKRAMPSNEQVEISSDDDSCSSDADNDVLMKQPIHEGDLPLELSSEAWLFRSAKSYQEYMKLIPVPTKRVTVIPYTSWSGLGTSMKNIYRQPLHYLTNLHLKRMDQERIGAEDEAVLLYTIIHPAKAEATIWLIEEAHRLTSSPHHLAKLWAADAYYDAYIDDICPKLGK